MDLAMLNRLRVNAGKPELKAWKASKGDLAIAIKRLQGEGFTDALPGANINAIPAADDPKLLEPFKEPEKEEVEEKPEKVTKIKTQLARGIETEGYAKHSRKAVQDIRRDEAAAGKAATAKKKADKKADKKVKLDEVDTKQGKAEAEDRKKTKKVKAEKPKKDKKPKAESNSDEITVAGIARQIDIDPRVARAKLRRHEDKIKKLHTKGQDRWTFPKSAAKEIKAILQGTAK